jgi:hypothetical protein
LRAKRGRYTRQVESGERNRNCYGAVVLECGRESIRLLFKNQLPHILELQFGQRHFIDGLGRPRTQKLGGDAGFTISSSGQKK